MNIVLSTLNAKYVHASFGLRYLYANLGELREQAVLTEFDINQQVLDIAEALLALEPRILGLGVYIWNAEQTLELVTLLRRLAPSLIIVLGGPEVSHETEAQTLTAMADYVVCGEGEVAFAELCRALLDGRAPADKIIRPTLPELTRLIMPYAEYTDTDVAHRVIYVEASRGCPFSCEFCLSSLDERVRSFPLDAFLAEMDTLIGRGVRQFKFVDRTFNLQIDTSRRILQFFLERMGPDPAQPALFVHFEMIPDRLPVELREVIAAYPPGALQFEVGVQTLSVEVEKRISRRQNHLRMADNFAFLRDQTGVHVHADLIIGLPGEDMASFAAGFDRLHALGPAEIQVGVLKRLRGTPIIRHDREFDMVYAGSPPYEILRTGVIDFVTMQRLKRFARYWDIFANSGNFSATLGLLLGQGSAFAQFLGLSDWLKARIGKQWGIALSRQYELVWEYLTEHAPGFSKAQIAPLLLDDYLRAGRKDHPLWLLEHLTPERRDSLRERRAGRSALPKRQARHLAVTPPPTPSTIIHE